MLNSQLCDETRWMMGYDCGFPDNREEDEHTVDLLLGLCSGFPVCFARSLARSLAQTLIL